MPPQIFAYYLRLTATCGACSQAITCAPSARGRQHADDHAIDAGVPTTVRTPMGRDIAAACGQLRAQTQPRAKAS